MKKKFISVALLLFLFFAFTSCEILSTIQAALGFYDEYQTYSSVYEDATQMTISAETTLTISESTVPTTTGSLNEIDTYLYLMIDQDSPFVYVEEDVLDLATTSVFETDGDLYIQYEIAEGDIVTPVIPEAEDRFDSSYDVDILNENFSYESVTEENKLGDHHYEFYVELNQAINLDALGSFVDELALFGGDESSFDSAVAHVEMIFTEEDYVIDVTTTLEDYTITFSDDTYVTLTLVNHTILSVPDDFEMPNVFAAPYQYVAVDNATLARRAYVVDETILYPVTASENGYNLLELEAGTYQVESALNSASFTYEVYDSSMSLVDITSGEFVVAEAGDFYLKVMPTASFVSDIVVTAVPAE